MCQTELLGRVPRTARPDFEFPGAFQSWFPTLVVIIIVIVIVVTEGAVEGARTGLPMITQIAVRKSRSRVHDERLVPPHRWSCASVEPTEEIVSVQRAERNQTQPA